MRTLREIQSWLEHEDDYEDQSDDPADGADCVDIHEALPCLAWRSNARRAFVCAAQGILPESQSANQYGANAPSPTTRPEETVRERVDRRSMLDDLRMTTLTPAAPNRALT